MDLITSQVSYKTRMNAVKALRDRLNDAGLLLEDERWLIAVNDEGRFVPTLVGIQYCQFAHVGIMVVS